MKNVCYYHGDADGVMSGAIVKCYLDEFSHLDEYFGEECEFIKINYGEMPKYDENLNYCVIVDFSFDEETMKKLIGNSQHFIWIDHHKTAKEKLESIWNDRNIKGNRDLSKAGCILTWEYFFSKNIIPFSVKYIGDRDIWKFEYGEDTKAFYEIFNLKHKEIDDELVYKLSLIAKWEEDYIEKGKILIEKRKEQVELAYSTRKESVFVFEGYKTCIINSQENISEIGEYGYNKGYDIVLIWNIKGNKMYCSLRSKDVDVSKIAEKYGGGGHPNASGFTADFSFLEKIYG
jgi:uncharacterized protein